jgi:hypothetical protein
MQNIPWKNDEVVFFGKHIVTKREVAWYDSDYLYTQDINLSRYGSEDYNIYTEDYLYPYFK